MNAMSDPKLILQKAIEKGELIQLLLGAPEYCYRSRWSPAPGNTDLTELLGFMFHERDLAKKRQWRDDLLKALNLIVETYEGLDPVATCILMESLHIARYRQALGLPLDDLAKKLHKGIMQFRERLELDRSGLGDQWSDGMLGEFRRLSKNTVELGGPSFFCD